MRRKFLPNAQLCRFAQSARLCRFALRRIFLMATMLFGLATVSLAEDVIIPTTDEHPFDLTKGTVTSSQTRNWFTDFGLENMYDGDLVTYTLQNQQDTDYYNVSLEACRNAGTVTVDFNLKSADGSEVVATVFNIESTGLVTYTLQTPAMKKGRYTLTLTFHQASNKSWQSARVKRIAFEKPRSLKPGEEIPIVNAEFEDLLTAQDINGWTRTGGTSVGQPNLFGNTSAVVHFNYGVGMLSQSVYNLPNGLYMLRMNVYDGANNLTGTDAVEQDTYVFLNDRMVPMKTAFDETVGYRNIYRWYEGRENIYYRRTSDGRWLPTQQVEWNEALAMAKHFYENCVVMVVIGGKATFGWKKTGDRSTRIVFDHVTLTYLSDKTSISEAECAALEREQVTNDYKARLAEAEQAVRTELAAKRPHAPQAVIEANATINTDIAYTSNEEYIDALLHLEHLLQRLKLPFYDITLSNAGMLADQFTSYQIQTNDTVALKISGTMSDDDLAALMTLDNVMEVDLSDATLTALPRNQFLYKRLLTWVTLPGQLESIGNRTFSGCWSLRDVTLPATLKSIDERAFEGCRSLDRVVIPEGTAVGNKIYDEAGLRSVVLPASMRTVSFGLCSNCSDLIDIQFSGQVVIEESAFANCTNLRTLHLPEGVEFLMSSCFGGCTALPSVTLPSTVKYMRAPFHNCKNLKEITCLTIAPPYPADAHIHGDIGDKDFTLFVPQQAVDDYQAAKMWSDFDVVGTPLLPPTLTVTSPLTFDDAFSWPSDYKPDMNMGMIVNYWGGAVGGVLSRGTLTNDCRSMLSMGRMAQQYNFYNCRSYGNADNMQFFTSLINNGQMRADDVSVELRFNTNNWENIAFPFDVRVSDIEVYYKGEKLPVADAPFVIYGYDARKRADGDLDNAWVRMTADSTLHAGHGYIWSTLLNGYHAQLELPMSQFIVHAVQNANKPLFFRSDNVEVKLDKIFSEFAHNRSWNFIGNPYPCFFDSRYMDTTSPIIVWEYQGTVNERYTAYSPLDDNYILHPGQAFFIQRPLDQENVIFDSEGRQHSLMPRDYIPAGARRAAAAAQPRQVYNLLLDSLDRTRFVINEAATLDYEPGRDASKFTSLNTDAALLYVVRDGVRYAIDERPLADGLVHLGLQLPKEGTYTISLQGNQLPSLGEGQGVGLIDYETGTETDLTAGAYTFHAEAGTHDSRFTIRLCDAPNGIQTIGMDTEHPSLGEGRGVALFDLQGRRISQPQKGIYVKNNKKVIIK